MFNQIGAPSHRELNTTKNNESTEMVEIGNSFEKGKQYMRQSEKINV